MIKFVTSLLIATLLLIGCSSEPALTPEEQIEAWVANIETSAKEKSLSELKKLISPDYQDSQGYDRQKLLLTIRMIFRQNEKIGISNDITDISVNGETAIVQTLTSFSGSQLGASFKALSGGGTDTYKFSVNLVKSGDAWQATSVTYTNN